MSGGSDRPGGSSGGSDRPGGSSGRSDRLDDTMRERAAGSTRGLWLLLDADRRVVAGVLSGGLWIAIVAVGVAHPTEVHVLLTRGDPVESLYQGLVTATVTGVTLVLTLSQLVLSQELGPLGDQRDRMEGAMQFRADAADVVGTAVSPAEPSAFLRTIVRATGERAEAVREAVEGSDLEDGLGGVLDSYLDSVIADADAVTEQLTGSEFGAYEVVRAALNYNYSWKLYAGRRIFEEHGDALPERARSALETLVDTLELFGPAREHFKTLYLQWELSNLSRALLAVAVPALAVAVTTLVYFEPREFGGATLGLDHSLLVLATTTTVSLVPFTVFLSYFLRAVTITKRTLSIGPFILRETDRDVDVEWEEREV